MITFVPRGKRDDWVLVLWRLWLRVIVDVYTYHQLRNMKWLLTNQCRNGNPKYGLQKVVLGLVLQTMVFLHLEICFLHANW